MQGSADDTVTQLPTSKGRCGKVTDGCNTLAALEEADDNDDDDDDDDDVDEALGLTRGTHVVSVVVT